jgi:peroxiredoxin (alkyl hydroperoxide reductase subunit C)
MKALAFLLSLTMLLPAAAGAQVLGSCGTPDADKPAPQASTSEAAAAMTMPLPGDQAPNFQLPAVAGDEIRMIKLSDYDGQWRVVCFYPADFTFV